MRRWVPVEVFKQEAARRRAAGWVVPADGMGRVSLLLTEADCYFDKRYNEWLAPSAEVADCLRELRHLLDVAMMSGGGPVRVAGFAAGTRQTKEERRAAETAAINQERRAEMDRAAEDNQRRREWEASPEGQEWERYRRAEVEAAFARNRHKWQKPDQE